MNDEMKEKFRIITVKYSARIEKIKKTKEFPETTFKWSGQHKQKYLGVLINREQSNCIREMITCIVNRLDAMGLLLHREKQTQI